MVSCVVNNCKNCSGKISKSKDGITFHRFPRDMARRRQWESAVNREENWYATLSSAVCSNHFRASDFYLTESGLRKLSADAIPSINISVCQTSQPDKNLIISAVDIEDTDSKQVINLKQKIRRLEVLAENRKRRLSLMWQKKMRLKNKVETLKRMIKHLIKSKQEEVKRNSGKFSYTDANKSFCVDSIL